jgi:hypothetical protein
MRVISGIFGIFLLLLTACASVSRDPACAAGTVTPETAYHCDATAQLRNSMGSDQTARR